eukprot:TRINITY_DN6309_c0_g1_i1.p1 TRINITY_DN6309_c0_g1~~TRINITY_DN6309_c0_g1_i1.p1  ORF type:complete len:152 (+),score=41.22 TRINITY_DN6309_c0_g1_i1:3-458(+)
MIGWIKLFFVWILMSLIGMFDVFFLDVLSVQLFPQFKEDYANPYLFRDASDRKSVLIVLAPFLTSIVIIFLRCSDNRKILLPFSLTLKYALISIPGMVITFSSFQLSLGIVSWWWGSSCINAFILSILAGLLVPAEFLGGKEKEKEKGKLL